MIRETFQCVKQVVYVLPVREGIKTGDSFVEEKMENNFVLEMVDNIWGKYGTN